VLFVTTWRKTVQIRKSFKFRIYPSQTQRSALAVQFGPGAPWARFVYNFYRAAREDFYLDTGKGLSYEDCAEHLVGILKVDYPWLKEADSQTLQQTLKNLDRAYINFFEGRAGCPHFKSKHGKQLIRYPQRFKINGKQIYLPKVGWVKTLFHQPIEGEMKNCTVSKTKSGRYFVSLQCEVEADCGHKNKSLTLNCGVSHDRDENAAINILLAMRAQSAHQATVGATERYATGETTGACKLVGPFEAQAFKLG
jgi:transposase